LESRKKEGHRGGESFFTKGAWDREVLPGKEKGQFLPRFPSMGCIKRKSTTRGREKRKRDIFMKKKGKLQGTTRDIIKKGGAPKKRAKSSWK